MVHFRQLIRDKVHCCRSVEATALISGHWRAGGWQVGGAPAVVESAESPLRRMFTKLRSVAFTVRDTRHTEPPTSAAGTALTPLTLPAHLRLPSPATDVGTGAALVEAATRDDREDSPMSTKRAGGRVLEWCWAGRHLAVD